MSQARSGQGVRLTDRQRLNWLRLIRSENIGPATFRDLVNRFGSAEAALENLPDLARRSGVRRLRIASVGDVEAELDQARKMDARFVAIGEPDYPPTLRQADQPPPLLAMRGTAEVFALPPVAIVGARNASLVGIKMARLLAGDLGKAGFAVVSGLARGIDRAAHEASVASGTVAVLAGGLDRPYPPENVPLMEEIARSGGAVVSEMPFGWEPRARDFPRRNRIVAGLSLGLVVVEAAYRSGSLISARLAGEMGRLVFAVPGSPLDPRAAGANGLLKDGAILVTEADDVIRQIRPILGRPAAEPDHFADPPDLTSVGEPDLSDRQRVAEALGPAPVALDEIIRHTGLQPATVMLVILELDLAGRIERHAGGQISLVG